MRPINVAGEPTLRDGRHCGPPPGAPRAAGSDRLPRERACAGRTWDRSPAPAWPRGRAGTYSSCFPRLIHLEARPPRPVTVWKTRRLVFRVAAELEDVPLGNPHVFQQHPGAVRKAFYFLAAQFRRETRDRL